MLIGGVRAISAPPSDLKGGPHAGTGISEAEARKIDENV